MAMRLRETILSKLPTPPGMEHRTTAATSLLTYGSSSAGAVTGRRAAKWWWNKGSIPENSKSKPPVGPPSCLLAIPLGVNWSGREADDPRQSSVKIQNKRIRTSTPSYDLLPSRTN